MQGLLFCTPTLLFHLLYHSLQGALPVREHTLAVFDHLNYCISFDLRRGWEMRPHGKQKLWESKTIYFLKLRSRALGVGRFCS